MVLKNEHKTKKRMILQNIHSSDFLLQISYNLQSTQHKPVQIVCLELCKNIFLSWQNTKNIDND